MLGEFHSACVRLLHWVMGENIKGETGGNSLQATAVSQIRAAEKA